MAQDLFNNDVHVNGALSCKSFNAPAGSITASDIQAAAGIEATKVIHQFALHVAQAPGTAIVAATTLLHTLHADAELVAIEAMTPTPATGTDRTVSIDLQKGNMGGSFATVLTAPILLDDDTTARTPVVGAIASPTLTDGDSLQVVVTVAGSNANQAQGLLVTVTLREEPQ